MNKITIAIAGTLAALALVAAATPAAAAGKMYCQVNEPISAAALNAPNNGYWSFEVFNAEPNVSYRVQVTYAADPSNGGHPNTGIETDASGHGITSLPRWWGADGSLPGYRDPVNPGNGLDGFIAVPGAFDVRIGPKVYDYATGETYRAGKTTCKGLVTE